MCRILVSLILNSYPLIFLIPFPETEENQATCVDYVENNIADLLPAEIPPHTLELAAPLIDATSDSVDFAEEFASHEMDGGLLLVNNNSIDGVELNHEESKDSEVCQDGHLNRSSPNAIKTLMRSKQQETNIELRTQIFKEIRKPGRRKYDLRIKCYLLCSLE